MIIDSWFDTYVGVVMLVRVVDGRLAKGERIKMMATGATYNADKSGRVHAGQRAARLAGGRRGGLHHCGIKELQAAKVGDTVTLIKPGTGGAAFTATEPLPGFKEIQPRCLPACTRPRPTNTKGCATAWKNSSSTIPRCTTSPSVSQALGFGFRCGFLGLLHMEIVQERWSASSTRT
jgi:GTP-binding protein LepA